MDEGEVKGEEGGEDELDNFITKGKRTVNDISQSKSNKAGHAASQIANGAVIKKTGGNSMGKTAP